MSSTRAHRFGRRRLGLVCLALVTTLTLVAGSVSHSSPASAAFRVKGGAVFNNPLGTKEARWRIVAAVNRAIAHTCPQRCPRSNRQTIMISTYLMDRSEVADNLIKAHRRGANVQVIMDSTTTSRQAKRLVRALGKADKNGDGRVNDLDVDPITRRHSFAIRCKDSCRSGWGNNHAKFYAFSKTGRTRDVVMVSSANLNTGGALAGWNDMYTMAERPKVYDLYDRVHGEMAEDDPPDLQAKRLIARRAYIEQRTGNIIHRFFPRRGASRDEDPSLQQLRKVRCRAASGQAGTNGRTVVKIAMFWWAGPRGKYLAQKVIDLDRSGCDVQVNYGAPGSEVSAMLRRSAHNGGVKLWDSRQRVRDGRPSLRVHHKMMMVSGAYGQDTTSWRVMTGTQNWTRGALTGADENTLEIDSRPAYGAYSKWFETLKRYSRRIGG